MTRLDEVADALTVLNIGTEIMARHWDDLDRRGREAVSLAMQERTLRLACLLFPYADSASFVVGGGAR